MTKRALLISFSVLLLTLPLTTWAANIPAKVFENGTDNNPIAVPGVKVQVFGGFGFKALFSSAESGNDGGCLLRNVPLGKEVLVKLTKAGYITQYDIKSYSDADVVGIILWVGSETNINGLYKSLGEIFDTAKGQVYLDISDETTGEGIDGMQLAVSSGQAFGLGKGEYLIANAEGSSLKIGFQKPGYAFDVESATIPLFSGAFTQYYIKVQSQGAISSVQAAAVTSTPITGFIKRLSDSGPISGAVVAFTDVFMRDMARPNVTTDHTGKYYQDRFTPGRFVKVTPTKAPWRFRLPFRFVFTRTEGVTVPDMFGF